MPQHNARKRVRAYLAAVTRMSGERIATYGGHTLTVPDLQELLRSERAARHHAKEQEEVIRVQTEKIQAERDQVRHLRAKNDTYVQRLKDWDALSPATLSAWKNLQAQNERLQKALANPESAAARLNTQAETIAKQAVQLRDLPTPEMWRDTQVENKSLRESIRTLREQLCSLREDPGTTDFLTLYETVRAEAVRLQDRNRVQAETIEQLNRAKTAAEKDAISVPALRALVEERGREIKELKMELDRARAGKPPLFASAPGGLSAEDLRKAAEDLLAVFLRSGK